MWASVMSSTGTLWPAQARPAAPAPLISVIVPCYEQAHLLPEAVASVQAQSAADWELLVVDDGSPDDTAEVASALAAADPRIRLLRKPNGGLSSARNAGLAQVRGRFVQFLDADDMLLPGKFERNLGQLAGDANALVVDDFRYLMPDGSQRSDERCSPRLHSADAEVELALRWELDLSIPIHAPLFPARWFAEGALRFDEQLPNHEDYAMWLRVMARHPRVDFTGQVGALYRTNPSGMTRNRQRMYEGFSLAITGRLSDAELRPRVRQALQSKQRVVDHQYGRGMRATVRRWLEQPIVSSRMWWPMQRAVWRATLANPIDHQRAVCRRFGIEVGAR
jgi:glycosyltransferase involved in cell wall biosynthesis